MIVVVGYHGMMAVLLKRVNAYSESQAVCQANFESLGLPFSDKEKRDIFGELFLFLTFEAFIFFAQILSLPLWMLRSRLSATLESNTFNGIQSFSEETYNVILHKLFFKMMNDHTNLWSHEPSKQALAIDHKTPTKFLHNRFEIDLWKVDVKDQDGVT